MIDFYALNQGVGEHYFFNRVQIFKVFINQDLDAPAPKLNELQAAGFSGIHSQRKPRGAVYIACNGRGAALFGLQGVEQQIVREQLGDIPLIGFSANGEIFRGALYGYTGVLALFF